MRKLKTACLVFLSFAVLVPGSAFARWATKEDASVILESSHDQVYVHADGSYDIESDVTFSIQKEPGIDRMKLFRIPYDPNTSKLTVLSASTTNGASVLAVPLTAIEDKAVATSEQGLSNHHVIIIPFPAVQVGSKLSYKSKHHHNAPFVSGLFLMGLDLARQYFTNSDITEIRSEIPLVVKHKGASDIASFEQGRDQNLYTLKVSLLRPVHRLLAGEPFAAIHEDTLPRAEIGAAGKSWADVARPVSEKLEAALLEPLPPALESIVTEASKAATNAEKTRIAMAKLIDTVKYLGDWRTQRGYYLPRTLAEIATTKQGDCKDFSFATVAMLRRMNIPAHVAWVHRGPQDFLTGLMSRSNRAFTPLLPGLEHFNHAIVAAQIDGKRYWLDPTNPVAHVGLPFSDIADRAALVLNSATSTLSTIPKGSSGSFVEVTNYLAFRQSGKADVMSRVRLSGSQVNDLEQAKADIPEDERKYALFPMVEPPQDISYLGVVREMEPDAVPQALQSEASDIFTYVMQSKGTKTSLGNSFQVPSPGMLTMLMMPSGDRVTGVNLGDIGVYMKKYYLSNFALQGDVPQNCSIDSRWFSVSRGYEKKSGGLIVTDRLMTKVAEITHNDAMSPLFEDIEKKLAKCFDNPLLVYKWQLPDPRQKDFAPFSNPIINNKKDLEARASKISSGAAQDYYRYTYSKMLTYEILHSSAKDAAHALGRLGHYTGQQAYINSKESVPEDMEEKKYLLARALQMDPDELTANLNLGDDALDARDYDRALSIAERILLKHPKSPGAIAIKFDVWMYSPRFAAERMTKFQQIIDETNEILKDDDSCKVCLLGKLMEVYQKLGKQDEIEKVHRRLIEAQPKSAWALLNFAGFLNQMQRYEEAAEYARKSLKVAQVGMAHLQLSWALSGLAVNEFTIDSVSPKGISLCEEALEHDRRNRNCLRLLGEAYFQLGEQKHDPHLQALSREFTEADGHLALTEGKGPYIPLIGFARGGPMRISRPAAGAKTAAPSSDAVRPTTTAPAVTAAAQPLAASAQPNESAIENAAGERSPASISPPAASNATP